jgi:hypothetical protein
MTILIQYAAENERMVIRLFLTLLSLKKIDWSSFEIHVNEFFLPNPLYNKIVLGFTYF